MRFYYPLGTIYTGRAAWVRAAEKWAGSLKATSGWAQLPGKGTQLCSAIVLVSNPSKVPTGLLGGSLIKAAVFLFLLSLFTLCTFQGSMV